MKNEPEWLINLRDLGMKASRELPYEKNPLYIKHFEKLGVDPEWIFENSEPRLDASIPKEYADLLSIMDEPVVIHVDAAPVWIYVPHRLSEKGLTIMKLEEALSRNSQLVKKALTEGPLRPSEEKLLGLITASLNSGVLIHAPRTLDEQVNLRSIWLISGGGPITSAATIIHADQAARISIIEEYHSYREDGPGFLGHQIHVYAGAESQIKHVSINDASTNHELIIYKRAIMDDYASHRWVGATIGGAITHVKIDNYLQGRDVRTDTLEASIMSKGQRLDMTINLHHRSESTNGRAIAKSIGMHDSRTILKGIISIEREAKNSNAYLAEHALLLSNEARAEAIPALEIKCSEVRATHSASVSQIDQEQVWYLMTRGIPREDAVKIIALGFFEPLVREIDISEVRWNVRYLLEKKWQEVSMGQLVPESIIDLYVEPEDVGKTPEDIFGKHYKYLRRRRE